METVGFESGIYRFNAPGLTFESPRTANAAAIFSTYQLSHFLCDFSKKKFQKGF